MSHNAAREAKTNQRWALPCLNRSIPNIAVACSEKAPDLAAWRLM